MTIGSLVTVNPLWHSGDCDYCRAGLTQLCVNRRLLGAHRPGAFAEYISVPAKLALILPDGMDTRIGALTEPVGCAVRAMAWRIEGGVLPSGIIDSPISTEIRRVTAAKR